MSTFLSGRISADSNWKTFFIVQVMGEYAPAVYRTLNGIFCIYKPTDRSMKSITTALRVKLSADLNAMKTRPVRRRVIIQEENLHTGLPVATTVPDIADHPLVVGPRYIDDDIMVENCHGLDAMASGIVVMGIGNGCRYIRAVNRSRYIKTHHVTGQLGWATDDFRPTGRLVHRCSYRHVTNMKIDKVIAAMQASHQKAMFESAGIDPQSQEAYDIASRGLLRPDIKEAGPVVYGMKCVHYDPPDFTLEVHSVFEDCNYLRRLIHLLAVHMKTGAVCTQVRRIRYGHFNLDHALLHKHWTTEHIRDNIALCQPLVTGKKLFVDGQSQEITGTEQSLSLPVGGPQSQLDDLPEALNNHSTDT